jgi:vitamin K-dependent gamma-carboxylase
MIKFLYRPIDTAILITFRIFTGILMSQELINHLLNGKFEEYIYPRFHFSYLFFDWVKPWPFWGMVVHYALTIFSGYAVAFNFHYRFFSIMLFLGHTLLFLMESAHYINHAYLYCLISFWMIFLPLDKNNKSAPAWTLYLILFHMCLAYFFGGIAKLNADWLSGTPMDIFLKAREHYPLGFIYKQSWAPFAFSYGGVFFDLLIVPMMLFRQTRVIGLFISILFHVSNVLMFGLATFPWFSLLLTLMFFDPSWPRKVPILKNFMPWGIERAQVFPVNRKLLAVLSLYVLVHLSLPFRHLLYPGNTNWTEQGHNFAWRMMLRSKSGIIHFFVKERKKSQMEMVDIDRYITSKQKADLVGNPDFILQFAHFIHDEYKSRGLDVSVFASSRVSLNGRPNIELVESGTDLTMEERTLAPYSWIRPLPEFSLKRKLVERR